jgi:hypothetical protein
MLPRGDLFHSPEASRLWFVEITGGRRLAGNQLSYQPKQKHLAPTAPGATFTTPAHQGRSTTFANSASSTE